MSETLKNNHYQKYLQPCYIHYIPNKETIYLSNINDIETSLYDYIKLRKYDILRLLNSNSILKKNYTIVAASENEINDKILLLCNQGKYK